MKSFSLQLALALCLLAMACARSEKPRQGTAATADTAVVDVDLLKEAESSLDDELAASAPSSSTTTASPVWAEPPTPTATAAKLPDYPYDTFLGEWDAKGTRDPYARVYIAKRDGTAKTEGKEPPTHNMKFRMSRTYSVQKEWALLEGGCDLYPTGTAYCMIHVKGPKEPPERVMSTVEFEPKGTDSMVLRLSDQFAVELLRLSNRTSEQQ